MLSWRMRNMSCVCVELRYVRMQIARRQLIHLVRPGKSTIFVDWDRPDELSKSTRMMWAINKSWWIAGTLEGFSNASAAIEIWMLEARAAKPSDQRCAQISKVGLGQKVRTSVNLVILGDLGLQNATVGRREFVSWLMTDVVFVYYRISNAVSNDVFNLFWNTRCDSHLFYLLVSQRVKLMC